MSHCIQIRDKDAPLRHTYSKCMSLNVSGDFSKEVMPCALSVLISLQLYS